jgi:GNAT superfamily N-acetyltransferase
VDPTRGVELTDEEEEQLEPLLRELLGPRAPDVLAFMDAFEDAHPRSEPHWYLSLLGTASRSRGQGIGMALLRDCLRRIDADGAPAYLESSNPVNDHRYEGVGFRRVGAFATPDGSHTLTTMWRPPAQG